MKRKSLFILLFFICCSVFAEGWVLKEQNYENNSKQYKILEAPEKYSSLKNSIIFTIHDNNRYPNYFFTPCKERILKYLEKENFQIGSYDGVDTVFLPKEFTDYNFVVGKEELTYIWDILSKKYAGFSKMKKRGLNKKDFFNIKDADELFNTVSKYLDDGHFWLQVKDRYFRMTREIDANSSPSMDPTNTYYEKETSNAYYVRFSNCWDDNYMSKFETIYERCLDKEFLILDARTNGGGSDIQQRKLRSGLIRKNYKGKVIILQDNWSFSSGELWHVFGHKSSKLNCTLIGTRSGGMQNYGNCENFTNKELKVFAYFGHTDFTSSIPSNYLGDCKGYEPELWATKEIMKIVLEEGYGADLTGILFN